MSEKQFTVRLDALGRQIEARVWTRMFGALVLFYMLVSPICCAASILAQLEYNTGNLIRILTLLPLPFCLIALIWHEVRSRRTFIIVTDDDDSYLSSAPK